jgi:HD-like signal output (HDOD) protein
MAFLCGLLHDIGMAATLLVLSDRPKEEPSITPAVLDEVLRQTHQEVSGMIAQLWKLPADVQMVVANHHTFPAGDLPHPLCAVVALAEDLSRQLGYGVDIGPGSCDRVVPATLAAARAALGLTDEQFAELQDTGKKLADGVAHEFQPAEQKPAAPSAPAAKPAPANTTTRPVAKPPAQQQARLTLWRRLRRWMGVN